MAGNKTGPRHRKEAGSWVGGHWFPELQFLPEEQRVMPGTRYSQYDKPRSSSAGKSLLPLDQAVVRLPIGKTDA